jgi:hypothetical protein
MLATSDDQFLSSVHGGGKLPVVDSTSSAELRSDDNVSAISPGISSIGAVNVSGIPPLFLSHLGDQRSQGFFPGEASREFSFKPVSIKPDTRRWPPLDLPLPKAPLSLASYNAPLTYSEGTATLWTFEKIGQLGDIHSNSSRLIARQ